MGRINKDYIFPATPVADENAIVRGEHFRFTVLTNRLIRIEYSKSGEFEDRATQAVINRKFDVPEYTVQNNDGVLKIITDSMSIKYYGGEFSENTLSAHFEGKDSTGQEWFFGQNFNLKGTARTLDNVNGECELEDGIMSNFSMTVLDDSKSLILADDGWIDVKQNDNIDIYLFAYKSDYLDELKAYYRLTGKAAMIPRYVLGNWWSRYYAYTQDEYENLISEFEKRELPFSVAVIDMDWHYTDIDPKYGTGWTGFSWNRELFPDHKQFLEFLHKHGLKATLNLHPAEGIAAHEERYAAIGKSMNVDIENEERVDFDITSPTFMEAYFRDLLNPMEDEGVDFWWMDWQQGNTTSVPGLDPLWMLNHYHYTDMQKRGIRPLIFSRYSGPGSHRYPIGFSGDTHVTWESLDFQPYFTANASNIGYGWWSHDIGGHMMGIRDDELVLRWVQFGVFSPIMRLHSSNTKFMTKEPWTYNMLAENVMNKFLRLRHKLIPYLYSMAYRAYEYDEPLIMPMYYKYHCAETYSKEFRNEYIFGTEMIAAPITQPINTETQRGKTLSYLPEGLWFDFFTGIKYTGGRRMVLHRDLDSIPVLVKAGGIIPMNDVYDISSPKSMTINVYPGNDGEFELYEDDGNTMAYARGSFSKTKMCLKWSSMPSFTIHAPTGDKSLFVHDRKYTIRFMNMSNSNICVTENKKEIPFESCYKDNILSVTTENINGDLEISFTEDTSILKNDTENEVFEFLRKAQCSYTLKDKIYSIMHSASDISKFLSELNTLDVSEEIKEVISEIITAE